jgi:hypothetical protein
MSKKTTWSPVDPIHFEGKTLRQLQEELVRAQRFGEKFPKFQQELRKRIAEQIGK